MTDLKKVIYCEASEPFWVDAAYELYQKHNLLPCYWIGLPREKEQIKSKFPNVLFHESFKAIRGIVPEECKNIPQGAVDADLLRSLAYNESIVMTMMNRMDPGNAFSYSERVRHYHRLLYYWKGVLDELRPDLVVFPYIPHVIFDYVLYSICKCLNIKTFILQVPPAFDSSIVSPMMDIEEETPAYRRYQELLAHYGDDSEIKLSNSSEEYLSKIKGDYSNAMPFQVKNDLALIRGRELFDLTKVMKKAIKLPLIPLNMIRKSLRPGRQNYLKHPKRRVEDPYWSDWEYETYKQKAVSFKDRLRIYYDSFTEEVDLNVPFIYVALHYQPEQTTSPQGGVFVDQLLMVGLLSKVLPAGWRIYVKENYWQNLSFSHGEKARSFDFYDDLRTIPNVSLVKTQISPFDLIDKSKAVATVTGTSGWEAIMRGKPALIFGYSWYRGCEGAFFVPTENELRAALQCVVKGHKIDERKVRLFMSAIEEVGFKGYADSNYGEVSTVSYNENVQNLAGAILSVLEG